MFRSIRLGALVAGALAIAAGAASCSSGATARSASPPGMVVIPVTALGRQISFALRLFNGKVSASDYSTHFAASFLSAVPPAKIDSIVAQLTPASPWRAERFVEGPTQTSAVLLIRSHLGSEDRMSIVLSPGSNLITGLDVQPNAPSSGGPSLSAGLAARASMIASLLASQHWDEVRADFDATMDSLSVGQLASGWAQMAGQLGTFRSLGSPIGKQLKGYPTYFVPVNFNKGAIEVQVSFDTQDLVAGLYLRPANYDAAV